MKTHQKDTWSMPYSGVDSDTYDAASGPRRLTRRLDGNPSDHARTAYGPRDLTRSRRVGLVREVCAGCGANTNDDPITHDRVCSAVRQQTFARQRERTGQLTFNQTSEDTGWMGV